MTSKPSLLAKALAPTAPFLVAVMMPISLVAKVPDLYDLSEASRTLALQIAVAGAATCLFRPVLKSFSASALIAVPVVLLWQWWVTLIKALSLPESALASSAAMVVMTAASLVPVVALMRRSRPYFLTGIAATISVIMFAALIPPVKTIVLGAIQMRQLEGIVAQAPLELLPQTSGAPDIYHILLDGYARADVIAGLFDVDTGEFLDALRSREFTIPTHATANYPQTVLSTNALFGMEYLDRVADAISSAEGKEFRRMLANRLPNTTVIGSLRAAGYKMSTTRTVYAPMAFEPLDRVSRSLCAFNMFELAALSRTPVGLICRGRPDGFGALHRLAFREAMDRGPALAGLPVFDFRHVLSPHPPFVIDASGRDMAPVPPFSWTLSDANHLIHDQPDLHELYRNGYAAQVQGLNKHLIALIDRLLDSPRPKIIILHGDHGSGLHLSHDDQKDSCMWERLSTFVAVYSSDGRLRSSLPPDVSLVNLYRIVFNTYFGQSLALLPNRHFYASFPRPSQFEEVSDELMQPCDSWGVAQRAPQDSTGFTPVSSRMPESAGPIYGRLPILSAPNGVKLRR